MDVISYVLSKKYTDEKCKEMDNIFQDYKNQSMLKTIGIEKELNDFKNTLQQVNVNQEAKQSTSGYGIVSLPKNAANGQVGVSVEGHTITQELNYNPETLEEWIVPSPNIVENGRLKIIRDVGGSPPVSLGITNYKLNTQYGILMYVHNIVGSLTTARGVFADTDFIINTKGNNKAIATSLDVIDIEALRFKMIGDNMHAVISDIRMFELPSGSEIENDFKTMTADDLVVKYTFVRGAKSTISAMRITSENEDKTEESTAYVVAKDKDNKIVNLRSLPNGVRDEVIVSGGKAELIKRVSNEYQVQKSDVINMITIGVNIDWVILQMPTENNGLSSGGYLLSSYPFVSPSDTTDVIGYSTIASMSAKQLRVYFQKGTTLEQAREQLAGLTLTYQLAEPEIIPIQVSGNIVSNPSGTIYIEPIVADAGVYNSQMNILHTDLPIKTLIKISKIDFTTGLETKLDTSTAVIAEDKLSFTHPDLIANDIVFFEYEYDVETTQGETTIEYYDSRYVIPDKTLPNKFYKWDIEVDNGVPSVAVTEV